MTCDEIEHGYESYVFGTLEGEERARIEAGLQEHLARGCPRCTAGVAQARELAAHLALAAPPAPPPAGLRDRVLAALSPQVWKCWETPATVPPLFALRADEGQWEETGVAGVTVKRLFADAAKDRVTMLVRMAPGSSYPRHRHAGPEECYVLEGDLRLPHMVLRAGDYQRAETDSVHGLQSTENGCLLLIVSSLHDQIEA